MKNILIVINTMGRAGAESALISMLKSFDYSRVSVSLLSIIDRGELFLDIPEEVHVRNQNPSTDSILGRNGNFYIAKKVLKRMFFSRYPFKFITYIIKNMFIQLKSKRLQFDKLFWRLLSETTPKINEEYDLAIAFLEGASTYYVADRVNAKKKIAFIHVNYEKAGYQRESDLPYYKKMDYICCVSDAVKNAINVSVFPELSQVTRVFPNIVNTEDIRTAAMQNGGFSDCFNGLRILTVARLHPQKGLDTAVIAFARLVKMGYENIRWYIIGDGMERTRLLKLIRKHQVKDKFILLGSQSNPYPYMQQSDIYVQPSRFEGLSLTLQEALILNKPCITTNFDGIPDLLHNDTDALVIAFSVENITNALKKLIDNKELRQGIANATRQLNLAFPNKIEVLYDIIDGKYWGDENANNKS